MLVVATAIGIGIVAADGSNDATATQDKPASTVKVEKGDLSAMVSLSGTLTHRAESDGSPYTVINRAKGTYTMLPRGKVVCGDVLYRVDSQPVLLLCGRVPAYRDLHPGETGMDVRQLNQNLHELGYGAAADVDPDSRSFSSGTRRALEILERDKGLDGNGGLELGEAVFLPESVMISTVSAPLGGSARPGAEVAEATSDVLEVKASLDASQQGAVDEGDRVQVTLPDNTSATGTVNRIGRVAQAPEGNDDDTGAAIIPIYITLNDPAKARGLDRAPVKVDITTEGVKSALSVPVIAIVGKSGSGFAVEVVREGGRRDLVAVTLGMFDTTAGRVQVEGKVHEGDRVVVPST